MVWHGRWFEVGGDTRANLGCETLKYDYFTLEADTPRVVLDAVGLSFVDAHRGAVLGLAIVTVSAGIIPTRPAAGFDLHLLAVEGRAVGAGLEGGGGAVEECECEARRGDEQ